MVGFVEKPAPSVARRLASDGALVNSMILAADGHALRGLFQDAAPRALELLRERLIASEGRTDALDAFCEALPT